MWVRVIIGEGNEVLGESYLNKDGLTRQDITTAVGEAATKANEREAAEAAELQARIDALQAELAEKKTPL